MREELFLARLIIDRSIFYRLNKSKEYADGHDRWRTMHDASKQDIYILLCVHQQTSQRMIKQKNGKGEKWF